MNKSIFSFFSSIRDWFIGLFNRKPRESSKVVEPIPAPNLPPVIEPIQETAKQQPKEETVKPAKTEKPTKEPFAAFVILPFLSTEKSTLSKLFYRGTFVCYILEDGYNKVKVKGETRIYEGVWKLKKRTYGKFYNQYKKPPRNHKFVVEIITKGFTDILMHAGLTIKNTLGCPLLGLSYIRNGDNYEIKKGTSLIAVDKFYVLAEKEFATHGDVYIKVVR